MKILSAYLRGLRVVELANVLAGPSVGMFFAGLGATVVKIENPLTGGDVTRTWKLPSEPPGSDRSAYFCAVNWGKHSVALDFGSTEGRARARGLCLDADIVILSFKKGDAEKFRLDEDSLRAENSKLITASITGYGRGSRRVGYDAVVQAESGFMSLNGEAGGPPTKMPVALTDVLAAHQLKQGILLALLGRELTGHGAGVTVSLFDTAVLSLVNKATNFLMTGIEPKRQGSLHPNIAPYGEVFQTSDERDVLLAVGTQKQFHSLLAVLGLSALAADERFSDNQSRVIHRHALAAELAPAVHAFPLESILRLFEANDIPAGPIRSVAEVCFLPEVEQRLLLRTLEDEGRTLAGLQPFAFELSSMPERPALLPPPRLGEHNSMFGC